MVLAVVVMVGMHGIIYGDANLPVNLVVEVEVETLLISQLGVVS